MTDLRVLFVAHGHPAIDAGGAELYAHALCREVGRREGWESYYLARTIASAYLGERDTPFRSMRGRSDEVLWVPDGYDDFYLSSSRKKQYSFHLDAFLEHYRPDVVDVQHTNGIGLDLVRQIRTSLPDTPIVYTFHEFQPICHARGLMLRTFGDQLCDLASPDRCHACFPEIPPHRFLMREYLIKSHLGHVDLFLAPSRFLRDRFVEWGIEPDRIRHHPNGCLLPAKILAEVDESSRPSTHSFGFFGQLAHHKGVLVLLRAIKRLVDSGERRVRLALHGTNLEYQTPAFRDELSRLVEELRGHVVLAGRYETRELPSLLRDVAWIVTPSIWWENSPLVIQEAFALGRPVICSDIGGMAESVADGVNGLHFRVGDPMSLAETLRRACESEGLWSRLREGIPETRSMAAAAAAQIEVYGSLLRTRRPVAVSR